MVVFDQYIGVMEEGFDYKEMLGLYTNAKKILSSERRAQAKERRKADKETSKLQCKVKET